MPETIAIRSLVQIERRENGARAVVALAADGRARAVEGAASILALAKDALLAGETLAAHSAALLRGEVDLANFRLLAPVDHPDPAHLLVSGTGLTHLGSAEGRDKMHRQAVADPAPTDSMKMFRMGIEGGKPAAGATGVQPEWFYKGDGQILVAPGEPLVMPDFAQDGGEEPEIAGIYLIGADGTPVRLGFALGNEFSDHVMERRNYLWLAHSKLRQAALGPELLLGELPPDIRGTSRLLRDGHVLWEKSFLSGEANMSHSIANLEQHHFKYRAFRRPGDVHVHFFGTATLSFSDGVETRPGDIFEIEATPFHLPVRNALQRARPDPVALRAI